MTRLAPPVGITLSILACAGADAARAPAIAFQTVDTLPRFGSVSVAPLPRGALRGLRALTADQWNAVLAVHASDTAGVPMLGAHILDGDTLRFVPRFPPLRGTKYIARFDGARFNSPSLTSEWTRPAVTGPSTTRVAAVYPSADTLPMNLLRMYIQFSAPMTLGDDATRRVRLVDASGRVVPNAFLVAAGEQELWDGTHTRLTVFFDPGRIKRDLVPHEALGLPLHAGASYALVVDSTWHDAAGRVLVAPFVKRFYVGPIDRVPPRTTTWRVTTPVVGSRDTLAVEFPEPLDHALVSRLLVVTQRNQRVAGTVSVGRRETRWMFAPTIPWRDEDYLIEVDTELEDLAGNNLKRPFDVMPGDTAARGNPGAVARISFRPVRGRAAERR